MSKRRRKGNQMRNRMNDNNEGDLNKVNGAVPQEGNDQPERIPANEQTWTAVQVHELRAENIDLQTKLLGKEQAIIEKDQMILQLRQQLLNEQNLRLRDERKKADEINAKLREEHNITLGRTLHKDDKTGEVYWLVDKKS